MAKTIRTRLNEIIATVSGGSALALRTPPATGSDSTGGITIQPGRASGSGTSGAVGISGGTSGSGGGGNVSLSGGAATTGAAGTALVSGGSRNAASAGAIATITGGSNSHASGTGGDTYIRSGTGNGTSSRGGNVIIRPAGSASGTFPNPTSGEVRFLFITTGSDEVALRVSNYGDVVVGDGAGKTNLSATGLLFLNSYGQRPQNNPTQSTTNQVALAYDNVHHKFYLNSGAAWRGIQLPFEFDAGNSGASKTLDWNNGDAQKLTLTASTALTLSNPTTGSAYLVKLLSGAGAFTTDWPGTVKWSDEVSNTKPDTTPAGKTFLINLYWDGTSYLASYATYS